MCMLRKLKFILLFTLSTYFIGLNLTVDAQTKNSFSLENTSIPISEIHFGGPGKDGIPALHFPQFIALDEVDFMQASDRVLGIIIAGEARAYPIKILNYHEIVNDSVNGQNFVVSYCPLCGTGMVFATNFGEDKALLFGVSGLLYNSDVLLYDLNTESLWSQIMAEAISGQLQGVRLPQLPALHTTFSDWQQNHPDSLMLNTETGYAIDYESNPYQGYQNARKLMFAVSNSAPRNGYHPKEQVLGIELNGIFKAYPFAELSKQSQSEFMDEVGGQRITLHWNQDAQSAYVENDAGEILATTSGYWFAWYTFHPGTQVFESL